MVDAVAVHAMWSAGGRTVVQGGCAVSPVPPACSAQGSNLRLLRPHSLSATPCSAMPGFIARQLCPQLLFVEPGGWRRVGCV